LTGIEISPKLIAPLQIDLAIGLGRYLFGGSTNPVGPGLLVTPTSRDATDGAQIRIDERCGAAVDRGRLSTY
jgi:hypothetical protein